MNDPHEPRPGNDPQRSVPQYGEYTGGAERTPNGYQKHQAGGWENQYTEPLPRAGEPTQGHYESQGATATQAPARHKKFSGGAVIAGASGPDQVVTNGMSRKARDGINANAAVVSAANPWTGSSFTTFWPIVLMMRSPPAIVPSARCPPSTSPISS
mgnify:CR=1 FL=1